MIFVEALRRLSARFAAPDTGQPCVKESTKLASGAAAASKGFFYLRLRGGLLRVFQTQISSSQWAQIALRRPNFFVVMMLVVMHNGMKMELEQLYNQRHGFEVLKPIPIDRGDELKKAQL